MALTRKLLATMGLDTDKIDQIIEAHTETVDGLKEQAEQLREQVKTIPDLEKKIKELEESQPTTDWESKFNDLQKDFNSYKEKVDSENVKREKEQLYRSLLKEIGIDDKRLDAILKVTDLESVNVENGAIADYETVKTKVADEWSDFIATKTTQGANVEEPPSNTGSKMSRDEIMNIKDTQARQKAIAENLEAFQ